MLPRCVVSPSQISSFSHLAQAEESIFDKLKQPEQVEVSADDEIKTYLSAPIEKNLADADILKWWYDRRSLYDSCSLYNSCSLHNSVLSCEAKSMHLS